MKNYEKIIYFGDLDHFLLFYKKYNNHELLQCVDIINCNKNLIHITDLGIPTDYKKDYLSNTLFIQNENFPVSSETWEFLDNLFSFGHTSKYWENHCILEEMFNVDFYFSKKDKTTNRFSLMEIE